MIDNKELLEAGYRYYKNLEDHKEKMEEQEKKREERKKAKEQKEKAMNEAKEQQEVINSVGPEPDDFNINTVRIIPNIEIEGQSLTFEQFRDRLGKAEYELATLKYSKNEISPAELKSGSNWLDRQISAKEAEIAMLKDLYRHQANINSEQIEATRNENVLMTNIDAYAKREEMKIKYMRAFPHSQITDDIRNGKEVDMNEIINALKEINKEKEVAERTNTEQVQNEVPVQPTPVVSPEGSAEVSNEEQQEEKDPEVVTFANTTTGETESIEKEVIEEGEKALVPVGATTPRSIRTDKPGGKIYEDVNRTGDKAKSWIKNVARVSKVAAGLATGALITVAGVVLLGPVLGAIGGGTLATGLGIGYGYSQYQKGKKSAR